MVKLFELHVQLHELLCHAVETSVQLSVLLVLVVKLLFVALALVKTANHCVLPGQRQQRAEWALMINVSPMNHTSPNSEED